MSLVDESPVSSSSSEGFAAFLDAELDSISDASSQQEEESGDETNSLIERHRTKRRKISIEGFTYHTDQTQGLAEKEDMCTHPGFFQGMCIKCGEEKEKRYGVALGYIGKGFEVAGDEIARVRDRDLNALLPHKKLYLVLDLDHTLLNSTRFSDLTQDEGYLMQDTLGDGLYKLPLMNMVTKLRPFVHTFLKEASSFFEMYIYTMGERVYAEEMAKLLDPSNVYFDSRIIARGDCTQMHQKRLDVVLGKESAVLILDDTEEVWAQDKDNLIVMERYHYFASSCKQFGYKSKSLSELRSDESDTDGSLVTVLHVLKRVHSMFYDPEHGENLGDRDVRQILRAVCSEVLKGCKIVFSRVFPREYDAKNHHLWMLAERLGAVCSTEVDSSVTHVISVDIGTEKSRWAIREKKFLVEPRWLEAANYLWRREAEDKYHVKGPPLTLNREQLKHCY